MKKTILSFVIFSILAIELTAGLINAQTLVTGKIYDSANTEIADASVEVICKGNPLDTITTKSDGTYAVRFDLPSCTVGDSIKVNVVKGNLKGEMTSIVIACQDPASCDGSEYISVLNVIIKPVATPTPSPNSGRGSSGGGGGGGGSLHFYLCGNGKCDTGETNKTCPKDCKTVIVITNSSANDKNETNQTTDIQPQTETAPKFFSRITGGFAGIFENTGTMAVIIFLVVILGLALTVRAIRNR